jgi:hypothetical protein
MTAVKFLLDEHVPLVVVTELRRLALEIEIDRIGGLGTPARGTPDPNLLLWCEEHGYSLVTHNRKSMPRHLTDHLAAGHHVPGIFVFRALPAIGDIVQNLLLVWGATDAEEHDDLLRYLPPDW